MVAVGSQADPWASKLPLSLSLTENGGLSLFAFEANGGSSNTDLETTCTVSTTHHIQKKLFF